MYYGLLFVLHKIDLGGFTMYSLLYILSLSPFFVMPGLVLKHDNHYNTRYIYQNISKYTDLKILCFKREQL